MASHGDPYDGDESVECLVREAFDWSETSPTLGVVTALSRLDGDEPLAPNADRQAPLYDYVDTDALDALFGSSREEQVAVTFSLEGYEVRVGDGEVAVARLDP